VAAIIERDGRFLLVEEETGDGLRLNQPAGHLEQDESLLQAVIRETLEETAYNFRPTSLIGVYLLKSTGPRGRTWLRFAFCGELGAKQDRALDHGIVRTLWLTPAEIEACRERHRTPALLECLQDYLRGQRLPLASLHTHASVGLWATDTTSDTTWHAGAQDA
jgi:8-oxo-dGTP pyrophosphatase MutT (NUDIX family)